MPVLLLWYADLNQEIDVEVLERTLVQFVQQCIPESEQATKTELVVEIWEDKTLRGTRNGGHRAEAILVRLKASPTQYPRQCLKGIVRLVADTTGWRCAPKN